MTTTAWEAIGKDRYDHLLADNAALRAMLAKHQWQPLPEDGDDRLWCPGCGDIQANGHQPDCKLAALLETKP
jgi:hypothetical protein